MQIYLIRHGETIWNKEGRYQGSIDVPLSEEGVRKLKKADFTPDIVYVTPLQRTVQTARIIFPDSVLETAPELREMCFGDFEGRTFREMENDADYRSWVDSGCMSRCPNGESKARFTVRIRRGFDELMNRALEEGRDQIVIVAHGGTQMALMWQYGIPKKDYFEWAAPNGCGYLLDAGDWKKKKQLSVIKNVSFVCSD